MSPVPTAAPRAPEERERLILEHMCQVKWIASSLHERLPVTVLQEDLISAGILGLIAAVDNFDASRNASLRTYAEVKIRGAMLDSIRALDSVPVHRRRRAKAVQAALNAVQQSARELPSDEDMAAELGLTTEEYRAALQDLRGATEALESGAQEGGSLSPLRYVADRAEASPGWILEHQALRSLLMQAIRRLPKAERTVVGLYFMEELSLAEIAGVLNLHTSRVSQLKLRGVGRLRSFMKKHWPAGRTA